MKHFYLFIIALFLNGLATAQPASDTTFIVQYRTVLDTARSMPKPERAKAYWNAAMQYARQAKWDTAAKALDKSMKLWQIDSIVSGDLNAMLLLSNIEHNRNRNDKAIAWAERSIVIAKTSYQSDSLIIISDYLRTLYIATGDNANAWRYKYFSDSIKHTLQNIAANDSIAKLNHSIHDAALSHQAVSEKLNASREEKNSLFNNVLLPLAAVACLLLIALVFVIIRHRKSKFEKANLQSETLTNQTSSRSAIHVLAGITDLMLQRGRTGDDLILLKAMEREQQQLWKQSRSSYEYPVTIVDDDRIIRSLKGIRILVYSTNTDSSFLLKNWLRRQIRLCDVQTTESIDTIPQNFIPHVIIYDGDIVSNELIQKLQSAYVDIPVIASVVEDKNTIGVTALQKPYGLNLLLEELIKVYKPQEETKVETITTDLQTINSIIQFHCNKLEKAYTQRNGDELTAACNALMPLFEQAKSPAIKWLKVLADPPDNISDVQIEFAYRNVMTYCSKIN